ncbi:unnamed protein product [Polarella glacialis]|uniref:Post-GPI attachment to proteins factor 3 n=1 Tax=Polarella glacialis TaxID=89957 RepID=A0A813L2I6_POLGL|nr:unnamed protein product [Polarella glacialis]
MGALCAALSPILAFWGLHIGYLSFVWFDYEHNMKVAVALGVCAGVSWVVWFLRHMDEWRSFSWKVPLVILGPAVALPLELLDFPPFWGLVDAHSLWHLCTVPVQFLIYDVVRAKMRHASGADEGKKTE